MSRKNIESKAGVALSIIVVGGGLSGLGSAYALRKAGHEVILIESADGTYRSSGGLRSPPNMTKVLTQWGLGPQLAEFSTRTLRLWFKAADTGSNIGIVAKDVFHEICKDCFAEFIFIEHGLLHTWLYNLAKEEGVQFRFNTKVVGAEPELGNVILENGAKLSADIIIGADGIHSVLRQYMDENSLTLNAPPTHEQSFLHLAFSIPFEDLDDELLAMAETHDWNEWVGEGVTLQSNVQMTEAGKEYAVVMAYDYPGEPPEGLEDWGPIGDLSEFGIDTTIFEHRVQKLLKLAKRISGRAYALKPCLSSLVCEDSRIILIGEAAHAFAPAGSISTSLSLEDAQTLGCLFARIQNKSQIQQFVTAYDEIRHPRAVFAYQHDYQTQVMLKLPDGPYRRTRDTQFARTLDGVGAEDDLVELFGNDITLYAHDAKNEVLGWWSDYGQLIMKSENRHSILSGMRVSVAVS